MDQAPDHELPAYTPPELGLHATLSKCGPRTALLQVNQVGERIGSAPLHLCMVLDTSGSMRQRSQAEIGDEKVDLAYYQLDLVVHSVKAMAKSLREGDLLTVVAFDNQARVLMHAKPMGPAADLASLFRALDGLEANGCTNMRPAFALATDCLRETNLRTGNNVMVFLTDGQPTDGTDLVQRVQRRVAQLPFHLTVHTVAFGRSYMDVVMLRDMARATGGRFVYLDGPNMMGTVTSALLANILTETHCDLRLVPADGTELPAVSGAFQVPGDQSVALGSLRANQPRAFLLTFDADHAPGSLVAIAVTAKRLDGTGVTETLPLPCMGPKASETTGKLQAEIVTACCLLEPVEKDLRGLDVAARAPRLNTNLKEVTLGLDPAAWPAWGDKYVPALGSALWHQSYYNYKDVATHCFGGPTFRAQYTANDDAFDHIPMRAPRSDGVLLRAAYGIPRPTVLQTASALNNASGGCYYGSSQVRMSDGSSMRVDEVTVGMTLAYGAKVEMILETVLTGPTQFEQVGSLVITPWHPIQWTDGWVFPAQLSGSGQVVHSTGCMRSFLVAPGETVTVEGIVTAALGHGVTGTKVLSHPFWGNSIRSIMRANAGRAVNGVLQVSADNLVLDNNQQVVGLQWP